MHFFVIRRDAVYVAVIFKGCSVVFFNWNFNVYTRVSNAATSSAPSINYKKR